jgi:ATP-dependent Clp protease ATP-binding subunit ClpB
LRTTPNGRAAFCRLPRPSALAKGHQRLLPDHLLKALIDDKEGFAARLIEAAGGKPDIVKQKVDQTLAKQPSVEGGGGQLYMDPAMARVFEAADEAAKKAGDSYVTVERLLLALALDAKSDAGKALKAGGVTPQSLNSAIEEIRQGRTANTASAEEGYDALKNRGAAQGRSFRNRGGGGRHHPVHRRDAHAGRRGQGRWRDGCLQPA